MLKKLVVGGGCFWGMEALIRTQPGVVNTTVGYAGGSKPHPTYERHTGHAQVVEIEYDDKLTSPKHLLDFFFCIHDPTTLHQQGNDRGTSYRSVIFYSSEKEKKIAQEMIDVVNASKYWANPVVTTLEPLQTFTPAEDYHQDYLIKNPDGYTCHYVRMDSYLK